MKLINMCIEVDPKLKEEFEDLERIHGMSLSNALEGGMQVTINAARSPEDILRKIDEKELEIRNLCNELRHIKTSKSDFRWTDDDRKHK